MIPSFRKFLPNIFPFFLSSKNFTSFFIYYGHPRFLVNPLPSTNTWRPSTPLTILQLHAASLQGGGCWRTSQGATLISKFNRKPLCYDYNKVQSIQKLTFFHSLARVNLPAGRSSANSAATQFLVPTSFKMQSSHASTFQFQIQSYLPLAKNYSREGPALTQLRHSSFLNSSSSTTLPSKPRAQLQRHEKITRRPSRRCHLSFLLLLHHSNSTTFKFLHSPRAKTTARRTRARLASFKVPTWFLPYLLLFLSY